ncbi:MAG: hypothetical protein HQK89_16310 [Nitrospirae bacterium]|nr:hypothetical protein [Nitrospirota bacterium]
MKDAPLITACGLVTPFGVSLEALWDALVSGKSAVGPIDASKAGFDGDGFACKSAYHAISLMAEAPGVNPKDARIMNNHSYMLMKCSLDAFEGGKLEFFQGTEIAFYAGLGMVDYEIPDLLPAVVKSLDKKGGAEGGINVDVDNNVDVGIGIDPDVFYSKGYHSIHPLWPLSMLNNIALSQVAVKLNLRGDSAVFSPHADSGAQAIIEGVNAIIEGFGKAAIAGGVSEKVNPLSVARGHLLGVLGGSCSPAPFSARRNGTVFGEGAAMFAIEKSSTASSRPVEPLARISGWGLSYGTNHSFGGPASDAIASSMEKAMRMASLKPLDIDVIIANGDGTVDGDAEEIRAINAFFGKTADKVKVYSSRGALGHLLAGAPAVDLAIASLILKNGLVPPTVTVLPIDGEVRFDLVVGSAARVGARRVLINALSYEGQSVSFIVEGV